MNDNGSLIITGCNSGIGEYLTKAFVNIGHTVFGLDKIKNETKTNLENGNYKEFICDLSDEKSVSKTFGSILKPDQNISTLINNAWSHSQRSHC